MIQGNKEGAICFATRKVTIDTVGQDGVQLTLTDVEGDFNVGDTLTGDNDATGTIKTIEIIGGEVVVVMNEFDDTWSEATTLTNNTTEGTATVEGYEVIAVDVVSDITIEDLVDGKGNPASRVLIQLAVDQDGVDAITLDKLSYIPIAVIYENGDAPEAEGFGTSTGVFATNLMIYEIVGYKNIVNTVIKSFGEGYKVYGTISYYR